MLKRIDRIEDVRNGDTAYLKDVAEAFTVSKVEANGTKSDLYVRPYEGSGAAAIISAIDGLAGAFWANNDRFDFATREDADVPTAPGFYKDADGDVWLLDGDGRAQYCKVAGIFNANGITYGDGLRKRFAPYTPMRLVEELV